MPGFLPQAQQQNPFQRIPLWIWIVGSLIVVLIGVLWTLRDESEEVRGARPKTIPEPVFPESAAAAKQAAPAPRAGPAPRPAASAAELRSGPEPTPPVAEVKAVSEPAETAAATPAVSPAKPDDLKKIVGIGPKISKLLNGQGIFTFEQLAATEVSRLVGLMEEQAWKIADPSTWPAQARKLAEEKRRRQSS